jgi:hypothetical protein
MTTPEAQAMARIVAAQTSTMKLAGFMKRRYSFNRSTPDGLVHVVHLWMAPKEPTAWTEVPGLRQRLYGSFRVDFGVYVPEMTRIGRPNSDWINECDCHLRRTAGQLMGSPVDLWWSLDDERASDLAKTSLLDYGLPWLDQFTDKSAIVEQFLAVGPLVLGMSPAGSLEIAELLTKLGRAGDASDVLERYVKGVHRRTHAQYLATYLPTIGRADLVPHLALGSRATPRPVAAASDLWPPAVDPSSRELRRGRR